SALSSSLVRVGELEQARSRLREACALLAVLEMPRETVFILEALAEWLGAGGRPGGGARLLGAAAAPRVGGGVPRMPHAAAAIDALADRARGVRGDAKWQRQRALGDKLPLADALAEANALTNPVQ